MVAYCDCLIFDSAAGIILNGGKVYTIPNPLHGIDMVSM